jgi:hypothetical protein
MGREKGKISKESTRSRIAAGEEVKARRQEKGRTEGVFLHACPLLVLDEHKCSCAAVE